MTRSTYYIVSFDIVRLTPRAHDPSIIKRNHDDSVYAFRFDFGHILYVGW